VSLAFEVEQVEVGQGIAAYEILFPRLFDVPRVERVAALLRYRS
jgi:hypothetical protein